MINEKVMKRLLDSFEKIIQDAGVNCMCVGSRDEFLKRIFENEMCFDGFVIIRSQQQSGILYIDTSGITPSSC